MSRPRYDLLNTDFARSSFTRFRPRNTEVVTGVWWLNSRGVQPRLILPDGAMDLIFQFQTNRQDHPVTAIISGIDQTAHTFNPATSDRVSYLGIQLQPWVMRSLLSVSMTECVDRRLDLYDVMDVRTLRDIESFAQSLFHSSSAGASSIVENFSREHSATYDRAIQNLLHSLKTNPVRNQIVSVAQAQGVSIRTLERRCLSQTGLSPGAMLRIYRFLRAKRGYQSRISLAQLSSDAGYSDQAHMTREFRRISGKTPVQFFS